MNNKVKQCLKQMCDTVYKTPGFLSERSWMYEDGLVMLQLEKAAKILQDHRFLPFLLDYCHRFVKDGKVPFVEPRPLSVDNINNGKVVLLAYQLTGRKEYWQCVEWFLDLYKKHPRIEENGGLWHKVRYPNQIWLDGLYMLHPFLASCGRQLQEENMKQFQTTEPYTDIVKQLQPAELYADIAKQFQLVNQYMYDEKANLYYHAYDHSKESFWCNKETGLSPNFWGRSLGWLGMACVDILEIISEDTNHDLRKPIETDLQDAKYELRKSVENVLQNLVKGIVKWQDQKTKVWYQLTALPRKEGNYPESSASAMFVYTLLKGIRLGVISEEYESVAQMGLEGLICEFYRERDGKSEITSVCQVAGLGPEKCPERDGTVEYYLSEPVVVNDNKGYGAFLGALCEYLFKEKKNF